MAVDASVRNSPGFWLVELNRRLSYKYDRLRLLQRYDVGTPPLPRGSGAYAKSFAQFQRRARTNLVGIANQTVEQFLEPIGFRTATDADPLGDEIAWGWWLRNRMLSRVKMLAHTVTSLSEGYTIVDNSDRSNVRVYVQSPMDTITAHNPVDPTEGIAGVRRWRDDQKYYAALHVPGRVFNYEGPPVQNLDSGPAGWTLVSEAATGLSRLAITRFQNRPQLDVVSVIDNEDLRYYTDTLAEVEDALPVQQRLNTAVLNRLTISAAQAFRQRWVALGENEYDPDDLEAVLKVDPGAVWALAGDPKFGEFSASDMQGILAEIQQDMDAFAITTSTPLQPLPGSSDNTGSTAYETARVGLRRKAKDRRVHFAEGLASTISLAFEAMGDKARAEESSIEPIWASVDDTPMTVRADAANKLQGILPRETIWRDYLDMTPGAIARAKFDLANDDFQEELNGNPGRQGGGASGRTGTPEGENPSSSSVAPDEV